MYRQTTIPAIAAMFCVVLSIRVKAQAVDDESILRGTIDSSYFASWAVCDTITENFLEGSEYTEVFGYPSITAIDVDRSKKSSVIKADQRFQLCSGRTALHCAGDSVERMRISQHGTSRLMAILNDTASYDEEELMCIFLPRHTFIFVDSSGAAVGVVELCFECGQISMSPGHSRRAGRTTLSKKALKSFEDLCESEGLFPPGVRTACWFYFNDRR